MSDMGRMRFDRIGELLKSRRDILDLGVRKAGRQIGISPTTITRIEQGQIPDFETLIKVCHWMGVSQIDLGLEASPMPAQALDTEPPLSVRDQLAIGLLKIILVQKDQHYEASLVVFEAVSLADRLFEQLAIRKEKPL